MKQTTVFFLTDDVAMDTGDVVDSDDADWYREEVGEEPDPGKTWRPTLKNRMPVEIHLFYTYQYCLLNHMVNRLLTNVGQTTVEHDVAQRRCSFISVIGTTHCLVKHPVKHSKGFRFILRKRLVNEPVINGHLSVQTLDKN